MDRFFLTVALLCVAPITQGADAIYLALDGSGEDRRGASYLQKPLHESWGIDPRNFYYVPWSGEYRKTHDEISSVKTQLHNLVKLSQTRGQPLVVVGHSWGSVLAYRAILELGRAGTIGVNAVTVFVTMGSPLNAQSGISDLSVRDYGTWEGPESIAEYVGSWRNYWISGDNISGPIPNAQENPPTPYWFSRLINAHRAYFRNSRILKGIGNDVASDLQHFAIEASGS